MSKYRNAFSRSRVSGDVLDSRTASVGVHKSLFSNLQQIGFDGSAAAVVAWAMVKAVRSKMADHKTALRDIGERPAEELRELRGVAVKTSRSEKIAGSPARAELIGDVICMLDGLLSSSAGPVSAVAPVAQPGGTDAEFDASMVEIDRRIARIKSLTDGGMPVEAAALLAASEAQ